MDNAMCEKLKVDLETNGFLAIDGVLTKEELRPYARLYNDIMEGHVNTERHRHDLGSHAPLGAGQKENICQVMWPAKYLEGGMQESVPH